MLTSYLALVASAAGAPVSSVGLSWQLSSAVSTIGALERTAGVRPADLLQSMHDGESGLCSEGVWHNSLLGVSRVLAAREYDKAGEKELANQFRASAATLGASLYGMSFDGTGFRKRSASGYWQSASEAKGAITEAGEDASFYEPSEEHRCASSAAACIFYSLLAEEAEEEVAAEATARSVEVSDALEHTALKPWAIMAKPPTLRARPSFFTGL